MQDALALLEGRWKLMILARLFAASPMRFSQLARAIPAASQKMLIQQLRSLEAGGVVSREIYAEVPPKVEYRLTDLGMQLRPVFIALLDWADLHRAAGGPAASTL
jgi:DNA-binding HxlR family transcriptional regulator